MTEKTVPLGNLGNSQDCQDTLDVDLQRAPMATVTAVGSRQLSPMPRVHR